MFRGASESWLLGFDFSIKFGLMSDSSTVFKAVYRYRGSWIVTDDWGAFFQVPVGILDGTFMDNQPSLVD